MDVRAWLAAVWGRERFAAWLVVALAVAVVVSFVAVIGGSVATNTPEATVTGSYDAANHTLVLTLHGESVRAGPTHALVVVVRDSDAGHRRNVTWVADDGPATATYPVAAGDTLAIDDPVVDADGDDNYFDGDATVGFALDGNDTATVVWRGRPLGAPATRTTTLGTVTVPP